MNSPRWPAATLALALIVHAVFTKWPAGRLAEMLWCCHVATAMMIVGLATQRRFLVVVGLLFHVPVGLGTYLIDVCDKGTTATTSVIVHVLPSVVGLAVTRRDDVRWSAALAAWLMFALLLPISDLATPAWLNVNLAHRAWPPLAPWLHTAAASWAFNLAVTAVSIAIATVTLSHLLPSRRRHG